MNIIDHIMRVGANEACHDILLLTTEPLKNLSKEYSVESDCHFEICAFTFSYVVFYLNMHLKKENESIAEEVHFYSVQYLMLVLEKNVPKRELQNRIPDEEKFILDKMIAYTKEIISHKNDSNYKPKFLFSSFIMFSTFSVNTIYERCNLINDDVAEKFSKNVNEFIQYLVGICENFSVR